MRLRSLSGACLAAGLSGCFVITAEDIREHDEKLLDDGETLDSGTDTVLDGDADTDADADSDTDADTDTDTVDTGIPTFRLDVFGQGFEEWNGSSVLAVVLDAQGNVWSRTGDTIQASTFGARFPDPLPTDRIYHVDLLVDINPDGSCGYTPWYTTYSAYTYIHEPSFVLRRIESAGEDLEVVFEGWPDYSASACGSFP